MKCPNSIAHHCEHTTWLSSCRLRLNPSKTLVIWLGGKHQVTKVPFDSVPILSSTVSTVESARDLGVVLDSQLTMSAHVNSADQRTISYVSYDRSCARCRLMPPEQSSKRSFRPAWTTVILSCTVLDAAASGCSERCRATGDRNPEV